MELLTFEEYQKISFAPVEQKVFPSLNGIATEIMNSETRRFYQFRDFDEDHEWRRQLVKRAISYQIDFFEDTGITTLEEAQATPQAFSAGRTSVTNSNSQSQETTRSSLLSVDARNVLTGTGLLYRGVGSQW